MHELIGYLTKLKVTYCDKKDELIINCSNDIAQTLASWDMQYIERNNHTCIHIIHLAHTKIVRITKIKPFNLHKKNLVTNSPNVFERKNPVNINENKKIHTFGRF
jgi:hypothetical protein